MPTTFIVMVAIIAAAVMLSVTSAAKKKVEAPVNPDVPELASREAALERNKRTYHLLRKITVAVLAIGVLASGFSAYVNAANKKAFLNSEYFQAVQGAYSEVLQDTLKGSENWKSLFTPEELAQYQDLYGQIPREGFTLQEPYVIYSRKPDSDEGSEYIMHYSNGLLLSAQAADNLKTIVYAHHSLADSAMYNQVSDRGQNMGSTGVHAYDTELYYFDTASGAFIGLEALPGPKLADELSGNSKHRTNDDKEVRRAVQARQAR